MNLTVYNIFDKEREAREGHKTKEGLKMRLETLKGLLKKVDEVKVGPLCFTTRGELSVTWYKKEDDLDWFLGVLAVQFQIKRMVVHQGIHEGEDAYIELYETYSKESPVMVINGFHSFRISTADVLEVGGY